MEKFTVEEFRAYLHSQDSIGDALYNLSEANIKIANISDKYINVEFDNLEDDPAIMTGMLGH